MMRSLIVVCILLFVRFMSTAFWLEEPRLTGDPSSDPGNGSLGIDRRPMAEVCGLFWLQHLLGIARSWPATSCVKNFESRPESAFSIHACKFRQHHYAFYNKSNYCMASLHTMSPISINVFNSTKDQLVLVATTYSTAQTFQSLG